MSEEIPVACRRQTQRSRLTGINAPAAKCAELLAKIHFGSRLLPHRYDAGRTLFNAGITSPQRLTKNEELFFMHSERRTNFISSPLKSPAQKTSPRQINTHQISFIFNFNTNSYKILHELHELKKVRPKEQKT